MGGALRAATGGTKLDVELDVVPFRGWRREMTWAETGLPWVPPSPNVPTVESVYAFAATQIIETTNLSEGRGTCKPFEYIGAPFLDGRALADALNARRLPGVVFREVCFAPTFGKHAGAVCRGAHLIVTDPRAFDPIRTMLAILKAIAAQAPQALTLMPGFSARLGLGEWTVASLASLDEEGYLARAAQDSAAFLDEVRPYLLYEA